MALTTTAAVQALPGVPSTWTTAQIQVAIDAAEGMIARYCDRTFEATDYKHWLDPTGGKHLLLRQYPLVKVRKVAVQDNDAIHLVNSSTGATWREASVQNGTLSLTVVGGSNAGTSSLTLSGYTTMALLKTAIEAVNKGWTVTLDSEGDPASIRPCIEGSEYSDALLYLYAAGTDCSGYIPDSNQGILYRPVGWSSDPGYVYADYRAGYETIPDDLAMVCNSLAIDILRATAGDSRVTSVKVGNVAYAYAGGYGLLIEEYKMLLAPYRRLFK